MTDRQIKDTMRTISLIVDTREQKNEHVTSYLDEYKVPYIRRKLDVGDYSCIINGQSVENEISIERKGSLSELAANITVDRTRFEAEFIRASLSGVKLYVLVENADWHDVIIGNYKSMLAPTAFAATLLAWRAKYNVQIDFCQKSEAAGMIYKTLYYWCRNKLQAGEIIGGDQNYAV